MEDYIIIAVVLLAAGLAAWYVYRAKKRGQTCIGCPHAKKGGCSGCCKPNE